MAVGKPSFIAALANPLEKRRLALVMVVILLVGAAYCHGYERLLTGLDQWPGSLVWSATAVLPWLVLVEWSKTAIGSRIIASWRGLAVALVITAAASMLLETVANALMGWRMPPPALDMMRRLPALAAGLVAILWLQAVRGRTTVNESDATETDLRSLASSIDWVAAADNYVELHLGERVLLRRMTIGSAETQLAQFGIVRIHRRFGPNLQVTKAVRHFATNRCP